MALHTLPHRSRYHPIASGVPAAGISGSMLALGRIIFGGYFLYAGIHHFVALNELASFAAAKGVPAPEMAVLGSGALIVIGGLSLLTGYWPRLGAGCIMLFLLGVTPMMHAFWSDPAGPARAANLGNFVKNLALFGGACFVAALPEPWPMTIGPGAHDDGVR